jgi:hypothetical protein
MSVHNWCDPACRRTGILWDYWFTICCPKPATRPAGTCFL